MGRLIILVGLPGSGKSTYAKSFPKEAIGDVVWLSSDTIRKELYGDESIQGDPNKVFQVLHQRVRTYLTGDSTVIYDATNVNRKSRKQVISIAKSLLAYIEAHIVWCPYEECIRRDANRERTVGREVIDKFIKRWETPFFDEGIDKIKIVNTYDEFDRDEYTRRIISEMDIPHDNPHHTLGVLEHCNEALRLAMDRTTNIVTIAAAKWHDIGKPFTKFYADENKTHAHYYNHQNVGGYLVFGVMDIEDNPRLAIDVSWMITNHMEPFFNSTYYNKMTGILKDRINLLHSCDLDAH